MGENLQLTSSYKETFADNSINFWYLLLLVLLFKTFFSSGQGLLFMKDEGRACLKAVCGGSYPLKELLLDKKPGSYR